MTDMQPPLAAEPLSPLPHAHVLTYITGNNTAPRLRKIVLWGNLFLAVLYTGIFSVAALLCAALFMNSFRIAAYTRGPGGAIISMPLKARLLDAFAANLRAILLALLPLVCALTLFLCAGPASRGKRLPARTLIIASLPLLAALPAASALSFCGAIGSFLDLHPNYPFICVALLIAVLLLLATLLLKDLLAYAAWARKNPVEEKPSTLFLPLRQRTH
jgi:hypothetical protein